MRGWRSPSCPPACSLSSLGPPTWAGDSSGWKSLRRMGYLTSQEPWEADSPITPLYRGVTGEQRGLVTCKVTQLRNERWGLDPVWR